MLLIILLQAAIALGFIIYTFLGIVFFVGMMTCVPIVMKELRKTRKKQEVTPGKVPFYRQLVYFIISIVVSACIMLVVCFMVLIGLSVMIGPIM